MGKGGGFENEVCTSLSKWISNGERDDLFMRSQSSGGRFTQRRKSGKDTAYQGGDITFADPLGEPLIKNWNIEVKTGYAGRNKVRDAEGKVIRIPVLASKGIRKGEIIKYKDKVELCRWDVLDFLDSKQKEPVLQKMWSQCQRDAELTNRIPVLIFRRNGRSPCIMFSSHYKESLESWYGNSLRAYIWVSFCDHRYVLISLKDFFEWIPDISLALKNK